MRIALYFLIILLAIAFWGFGLRRFCNENAVSWLEGIKMWVCKPFWPGPTQLEQQRKKLLQCLGTLGFILYTVIAVLQLSYVPLSDFAVLNLGRRIPFILFSFSILMLSSYSLGQIFTTIVLMIPFSLQYLRARDSALLLCVICVICCGQLDLNKLLKKYFVLMAGIFLVCAATSRLGLIEGWVKYRDSSVGTFDGVMTPRYALGFMHSNTTGLVIALLLISWILIQGGRLHWWSWLVGISVICLIYKVIDSRGAALLLLLFFVALQIMQSLPTLLNFKIIHYLLATVPFICMLLTFILATQYDPENRVWETINRLSSTRLACFSEAFHMHGFTLWGQDFSSSFTLPLDNVYLHLYITAGFIPMILYVLGLMFALYKLAEQKAAPEIAFTVAICVYCMVETYCRWVYFNPALWLVGAALYEASNRRLKLFTN